jgi:hypothetical protein
MGGTRLGGGFDGAVTSTAGFQRRLDQSYSLTMWRAGGDTPSIEGDGPRA